MRSLYYLFLLKFLVINYTKGETFKWTSREYATQASRNKCLPFALKKQSELKSRKSAGNLTKLGKVKDIEVCGLLCCEVESCDLAFLENEFCFAVSCLSLDSCEIVNSNDVNSMVLTMTRTSGSDVWTRGSHNNAASHQPNILTKQTPVQKSLIPDTKQEPLTDQQKGSLIAISNHISNSEKSNSPMDNLLQKEISMIKDKQDKAVKKENLQNATTSATKPNVGQKIQDITDHYLKAEEKSDMTALQENETSVSHITKIQHRHRDLRHTLISPITIGAFTCMAVIAVSGFAMAIIKYQRDRHEYEDKQTQKP